jgi:hypothetical protein
MMGFADYSSTIFKSVKLDIFGLPCTSAKSSKGLRFTWNPATTRAIAAKMLIDIWQSAGTTFTFNLNGVPVWSRHRTDLWQPAEFIDTVDVFGSIVNGDNILAYDYHIDFGFWKQGTIRSITLVITLETLDPDPDVPPVPDEQEVIPPTTQISLPLVIGLGVVAWILLGGNKRAN